MYLVDIDAKEFHGSQCGSTHSTAHTRARTDTHARTRTSTHTNINAHTAVRNQLRVSSVQTEPLAPLCCSGHLRLSLHCALPGACCLEMLGDARTMQHNGARKSNSGESGRAVTPELTVSAALVCSKSRVDWPRYTPQVIDTSHVVLDEHILKAAKLLAQNNHTVWAFHRQAEVPIRPLTHASTLRNRANGCKHNPIPPHASAPPL